MSAKCPATGKTCRTRAEAKDHARWQRRIQFGVIGVYECEHAAEHPEGAGKFHVGHVPGQNGRRKPRRGGKARR